jgi:hypothetical protein
MVFARYTSLQIEGLRMFMLGQTGLHYLTAVDFLKIV